MFGGTRAGGDEDQAWDMRSRETGWPTKLSDLADSWDQMTQILAPATVTPHTAARISVRETFWLGPRCGQKGQGQGPRV